MAVDTSNRRPDHQDRNDIDPPRANSRAARTGIRSPPGSVFAGQILSRMLCLPCRGHEPARRQSESSDSGSSPWQHANPVPGCRLRHTRRFRHSGWRARLVGSGHALVTLPPGALLGARLVVLGCSLRSRRICREFAGNQSSASRTAAAWRFVSSFPRRRRPRFRSAR